METMKRDKFKSAHEMAKLTLPIFLVLPAIAFSLAAAEETLGVNRSMRVGETLVSPGQIFELGFFTPADSKMTYLGIWYKLSNETVVWVANRNSPLTDRHGVLAFSGAGDLVLSQSNNIVWSSNSSTVLRNPVVQLLDSGNLVLWDNATSNPDGMYSWQSFDYPSDTFLAGMKLGWDLRTGFRRQLTAWKSANDPSCGDFMFLLNNQGLPQFEIMDGNSKKYRTGLWNGVLFSGISPPPCTAVMPMLVYNETEVSLTYEVRDSEIFARMTLSSVGSWQILAMNRSRGSTWNVMHMFADDACETYGFCGPNGFCTQNMCKCLEGFVPESPKEWKSFVYSGGCKRTTPTSCSKGEGFLEIRRVKLPDLLEFSLNKSMSLGQCKVECLKNCSCTAYANSDIRGGGSGCLMWFGGLIDMRDMEEQKSGQTLYVRLSATSLDSIHRRAKRKRIIISVTLTSVTLGFLLLGLALCNVKRNRRIRSEGLEIAKEDIDLPMFDLAVILCATDNFSDGNVIGVGGFGPVYKGNLLSGQQVAVKRLSKSSGQGLDEFKNETTSIARLQHRNLVGLLGCCIDGGERILVYEYMENGSLNYFIFDQERSLMLTWQRRIDIIIGIAKGLLYLHQDSKLQVIHRDLKTSNILLDGDLNPKISDFGLARIIQANETEAKTKRVIGTYGYMAPEYAFDGKFSLKSDIYSFGVLMLEVISGKRNRGFSHPSHHHNLLGHAWLLWSEGKAMELMGECLFDTFDKFQVEKFIQVGLLCVQKFPEDRPDMVSVMCMFCHESAVLPEPKEPGYFAERNSDYSNGSSSNGYLNTENVVTLTMPEGR